jgi:hypothetical protein
MKVSKPRPECILTEGVEGGAEFHNKCVASQPSWTILVEPLSILAEERKAFKFEAREKP